MNHDYFTLMVKVSMDTRAYDAAMWRVAATAQTYAWCFGQNIRVAAIRLAVLAEIKAKFAAMMAERFPEESGL